MSEENLPELVITCESKSYVVFYEDKVLAVKLDRKFIKDMSNVMKDVYKEEGLNFFKRAVELEYFWAEYEDSFYKMDPVEIIETYENTKCFSYDEITKVAFSNYKASAYYSDSGSEPRIGHIILKGPEGKISFDHRFSESEDAFIKVATILKKRAINARQNILLWDEFEDDEDISSN